MWQLTSEKEKRKIIIRKDIETIGEQASTYVFDDFASSASFSPEFDRSID